jgi:formamidopyrimidine-DNA glycosylase
MPELPEVESFRQLLLPLVSDTQPIQFKRLNVDKKPPRKFLSDEDITEINKQGYRLSDVVRKGKLICMILDVEMKDTKYLFVHMGMTGRISTPDYMPELESLSANDDYPPPHTHLRFSSGSTDACFSDPRKFGYIQLESSLEIGFDSLAPDALTEVTEETKPGIIEKLTNKALGIKAILLDQKRALSGVGNWIADEVLYQLQMHPDQNYLSAEQGSQLLDTLHPILQTAVKSLEKRERYPKDWLFHYRWNSKKTTKDAKDRVVTFVTSGGRTSAIVPSLQKQKGQAPSKPKKAAGCKRELEESTAEKNSGDTKKAQMQKSKSTKNQSKQKPSETREPSTKVDKDASKKSDRRRRSPRNQVVVKKEEFPT